jgi:SAM-dependent methyltransferase
MTNIPAGELLKAIQVEYSQVALDPHKGYHFHTGREALRRIGYDPALYDALPEETVAAFAGTGNPFSLGPIHAGEVVVDVGSGAGFDALIASRLVGPQGRVVGVDMTEAMRERAGAGAAVMGASNAEFISGLADELPLPDRFADVLLSNGVLNLTPDKTRTLREWSRVLKPGGRLFIGDITLEKKIPQGSLNDISLWTG